MISIKPVLSDHLSYVAIVHYSIGRSHKIGLTVLYLIFAKMKLSVKTVDDLHCHSNIRINPFKSEAFSE